MSDASSKSGPHKRSRFHPLEVIGLGVTIFALAQLVVGLVAVSIGYDFDTPDEAATLVVGLLSAGVPVALLYWILKANGRSLESIGVVKPRGAIEIEIIKHYGLYLALSLSLLVIAAQFANDSQLDETQNIGIDQLTTLPEYLGAFLLLAIIVPIGEELFFRGFLFNGLKDSMPWFMAAGLSAIVFALAHGQFNVGLDTFALGFFSARLMHVTGSVWPSVILHGLKNGLAFGLIFVAPLLS
jgi:membrane protease YdiL (CAAX protease family)